MPRAPSSAPAAMGTCVDTANPELVSVAAAAVLETFCHNLLARLEIAEDSMTMKA